MSSFTAADVLAEVADMVKQSKTWVNGCKLTWKNANVSVRLYQVGDNVFCMWYAPRTCDAKHLVRHNYCIVGDSAQRAAAKVFAQMQKKFRCALVACKGMEVCSWRTGLVLAL